MTSAMQPVLRLVAGRTIEWLRQQVMALPDPLPLDHPCLPAMTRIAAAAPVLSVLLGRPSPVEVLARRRLDPAVLRDGARRALSGTHPPDASLILAGGLIAPHDAMWQLARQHLAEHPQTAPLVQLQLGMATAEDRLAVEDQVLSPLPRVIEPALLCARARLVCAMWLRPEWMRGLSRPAHASRILDQLALWADLATGLEDSAALAWAISGMRLIDPHGAQDRHLSRLIALQRPDGSFPRRLRPDDGTGDLAGDCNTILAVILALQLSVDMPRRMPPPNHVADAPLSAAMRQAGTALAARIAQDPPSDPGLRLLAAAALTRALSRDFFAGLAPDRISASARLRRRLAAVAFSDLTTAHQLRVRLAPWPAPSAADDMAGRLHQDWLRGSSLAILPGLPEALASSWDQAAMRGDTARFLTAARAASIHELDRGPQVRRAAARRIAARALACCEDPATTLPEALDALGQLVLLSMTCEAAPRMAQVA